MRAVGHITTFQYEYGHEWTQATRHAARLEHRTMQLVIALPLNGPRNQEVPHPLMQQLAIAYALEMPQGHAPNNKEHLERLAKRFIDDVVFGGFGRFVPATDEARVEIVPERDLIVMHVFFAEREAPQTAGSSDDTGELFLEDA